MLVTISEILNDARKRKYAVPAFDCGDYRSAKAIIEVAEEAEAPVILMGLYSDNTPEQFEYLSKDLTGLAKTAKVPVCIHLDHATDFETIKTAIDQGYSSVMIDASSKPFKENIRITKEVTDYAHKHGVSVEAELGHVGDGVVGSSIESSRGASGHDSVYTDALEMKQFIAETEVDCLAVSFGTSHGVYKCEPELNIELLEKLNEESSVPLVVHGGSGTPDEQMKEAIRNGITKVNIFSDIQKAFFTGMRDFLNSQDNLSLWNQAGYEYAILNMKKEVRNKFELCMTVGKCPYEN